MCVCLLVSVHDSICTSLSLCACLLYDSISTSLSLFACLLYDSASVYVLFVTSLCVQRESKLVEQEGQSELLERHLDSELLQLRFDRQRNRSHG